jgi:hypothetical protein
MKKKNPAGKTNKTIFVGRAINILKKPNEIAVIDEETQKKFPRLAVLSTQTIPVSNENDLQRIKDSEPKLFHDR